MPSKEPKNLDEMKADPKMLAAALAHARKAQVDENILFYFDKGNAQGLYPKYIDPKGPKAINIDSDILERAQALADKKDWGNSQWAKIIGDAKKTVAQLYWSDAFPRFQKTPEYQALTKADDPAAKTGDPTKAAKLLGIEDVAALKKAMAEKDLTKKTKALDALAVQEKLKQKGKDMIAALKKSGLM